MEPLIVLAVTFVLLWVLFILPQQRRVRAHQALVAAIEPGDEIVLSAGIYGRIVELSADEMTLAVAPGVELRVARQAVLRRVEDARPPHGADTGPDDLARDDQMIDGLAPDHGATDDLGSDDRTPDHGAPPATDEPTDR